MTAIRHLIANPEEVWAYKDQLRDEQLLKLVPETLYKGKFLEYMRAKAKALYAEHRKQHEEPVALRLTELRMKEITENWKQAAKRAKGITA